MRWIVALLMGLPLLLAALAGIAAIAHHGESVRNYLRALRSTLLVELALLVVAAGIGAVYERLNRNREELQYRPPGELIDIGGYRLHLNCSGRGGPTVVLDFGLDGSYLDWYRVQPQVANFARVCSYDRAGYGWSDPSPQPRVASAMAAELHTLLERGGEKPPYILVGHSLGSFNVIAYAQRYPEQVAGAVFVDGAHPDELLPFYFRKKLWIRMMQFTMPFGLPRWRGWCGIGPEEIKGMKTAIGCRSKVYRTHYDQWAKFPESAAEVKTMGSLDSLPLIVVSRDPNRSPDNQDFSKREERWQNLQEGLSRLSTDSSHFIAKGSGHSVPLDRPDTVVEAIRTLVERARKNASAPSN